MDQFPPEVQSVLWLTYKKAKAQIVVYGTYDYLETDLGKEVPRQDAIVAKVWVWACKEKKGKPPVSDQV
jgi:hypothetical protein